MRILPSLVNAQQNIRYGTQQCIVIKIDWSTGTEYYSDIYHTGGGYKAAILSFSPVSNQKTTFTNTDISAASVTLLDTDNDLRIKWVAENFNNIKVSVYYVYDGAEITDGLCILKGYITTDIKYDPIDKILSFEIVSDYNRLKIGFAPVKDDFSFLVEENIGKPWPICFGKCAKLEPTPIATPRPVTLTDNYKYSDNIYVFNNGSILPQSTAITVFIRQLKFSGIMSGDSFTVTGKNLSIYAHDFKNRPLVEDDQDATNKRVAWLDDTDDAYPNLVGFYILLDTTEVNKVINQVDNKIWLLDLTEELLTSENSIQESARYPRTGWSDYYYDLPDSTSEMRFIAPDTWILPKGTFVSFRSYGGYEQMMFVANLVPSVVKAVWGFQTVNGVTSKIKLPRSYYTLYNGNGTEDNEFLPAISGGSYFPTVIGFPIPLTDIECEYWSNEILVDLESSISGRTVAHHIEWFITQDLWPTGYEVNAATMTLVKSQLATLASDYVYKEIKELNVIIQDLAFQGMLAVILDSGIFYFRALFIEPTTTPTFIYDNDNVEDVGIVLGMTPYDDLVTHIRSTFINHLGDEVEYIKENNISEYGLLPMDIKLDAYHHLTNITIVTDFWSKRLSNLWRIVTLRGFHNSIPLQPFDLVNVNIPLISTNSIIGEVIGIENDTNDHSINVTLMLASRITDQVSGEPIQYNGFWNTISGNTSVAVSEASLIPIVKNPECSKVLALTFNVGESVEKWYIELTVPEISVPLKARGVLVILNGRITDRNGETMPFDGDVRFSLFSDVPYDVFCIYDILGNLIDQNDEETNRHPVEDGIFKIHFRVVNKSRRPFDSLVRIAIKAIKSQISNTEYRRIQSDIYSLAGVR